MYFIADNSLYMNRIFLSCFLLSIPYVVFSQNNIYYIDSTSAKNLTSSTGYLNIEPGNTYLLKCGDTFYFRIPHVDNPEKAKIIISSYGRGPKPVISLYKKIKNSSWLDMGNNIWRVDIRDAANYSGFGDTTDTNVGFLKVNNSIKGDKKPTISEMKKQWDFYSDKRYLYVFSTENPKETASSFLIACKYHIILLSDYLDISNIELLGTGAHGIVGTCSNIHLNNIDIREIGGSYQPGYAKGVTRYGNGIQLWKSSQNCGIENCKVMQVYDAAYTMQGNGVNEYFDNIIFKNNIADSNEQSFEIWIRGGHAGFIGCKFIHNKCYNAGYGWSHDVRPIKNVGVHVLNYEWEVDNSDLTIEHNIFNNAISGIYYFNTKNFNPQGYFKSDKNKIYLGSSTPILSGYTLQKEEFTRLSGLDKNSSFYF
jgi:hypothetical protein